MVVYIRDNRSSLAPRRHVHVEAREYLSGATEVDVAFPCQGNINIGHDADKMEGPWMATRERGERRN